MFLKGLLLVFYAQFVTAFSNESNILTINFSCNVEVLTEKVNISEFIGVNKSLFKKDSVCNSNITEIRVFLPNSETFTTTYLGSNIILEIIRYKNKILGVNLYESEIINNEYVFQEIRILEKLTTDEVQIESLNPGFEVKNDRIDTKPSFLKQYWWLIAIGILSYSILTADQKSMDSPETSSNEQMQSGSNSKRNKKRD